MKQTFKNRLVLREDKKRVNGECPIYYIIILNGKEYKLSTGKWIDSKDWDSRKREPKQNTNLKRLLKKDILRLEDYFYDQCQKQKIVTIDMLKKQYKGEENFVDLFDYYEKFMLLSASSKRESTLKSYQGTFNHLKAFKRTILVGEIDSKLITDFDYYLRVKVGLSDGGAWARHKNVKSVLNKMIADGLLEKSPYDKFKVKNPDSKTIYLEEEELNAIKELRSKLSPKMKTNVDRFLFSCYTGLRYSDVATLKWSDIKSDKTITKLMVKTDKIVVVPIADVANEILERYKDLKLADNSVFPAISNDKLNKALRTITKLAKINKKVSFHVARHTYGTILARAGTNAFIIMKLMGHTSVKQTSRYVHTAVGDLSSVMNEIKLFKKAG